MAWLWPCCLNFLGTWRSQTNAPDGVYHRDEPSPALRFLVDCCALIDPDVSASKIRRAKSAFEHRPSDEEAAAAYEQKSEIAENPDDLDL